MNRDGTSHSKKRGKTKNSADYITAQQIAAANIHQNTIITDIKKCYTDQCEKKVIGHGPWWYAQRGESSLSLIWRFKF